MSTSSESEDDYYGNAALKLQKLKNKFKVPNCTPDHEPKTQPIETILCESETELPTPQSDLVDDGSILDEILAKNAPRRTTRSKARQKKQGAATEAPADSSEQSKEKSKKTSAPRGRKRGRIATPSPRGRSRGRRRTYWSSYSNPQPDIPTYSVGNTYDYPDMSDNQALFTTKPSDSTVVDINDSIEENEELSVKVYWQNTEFFKFAVRKYQKLTKIYDYFAKKENVSHNNLLFTYNERILNPDDTPDGINYSIAKFIDGGIVHENVSSSLTIRNEVNVKNGIKIKLQCQLVKKPFETVVSLDEKLSLVMMKYAEHIEKPLNKLKFQFDGDILSGKSTPKDLELEGGECIDVIILS